jgi:hypothetical protein
MRIAKDQIVAGYPALTVRTFLRRCRFFTIVAETAAHALKTDDREATGFLRQLASLGLIRDAEDTPPDAEEAYEITTLGHAFANASAAKPVFRKTAEAALERFVERLHTVNASPEYVYRVESAVLFGSMLSAVDRLGDVDIAIELQPKIADKAVFQRMCVVRQRAAEEQGRYFSSAFDWVMWPRAEVLLFLKARSRTLSLHEWDQVTRMADVRYRVLWGDSGRIAELIPRGLPS